MDPVSIVGLIGSVVSLADYVTRSINRLSLLKVRYGEANVLVSVIIGQLCVVQVALQQIESWQRSLDSNAPCDEQVRATLQGALDGCNLVMTMLEERLNQLEVHQSGQLTTKGKIFFLWRDQDIEVCLGLLDRQVNVLQLLLNAIRCKTLAEQRALMQEEDTITALRLARESTESVYVLEDSKSRMGKSRSICSENTTNLSLRFDFDRIILSSRVYQAAAKSNIRSLVRQTRNRRDGTRDVGNTVDTHITLEDTNNSAITSSTSKTADVTSNPNVPLSDQNCSRLPSVTGGPDNNSLAKSRLSTHNEAPSKSATKRNEYRVPLGSRSLEFLRGLIATDGHQTAKQRSEEIDKMLRFEAKHRRETKVILLGSHYSGKSTVLKSLKILFEGPYSSEEHKAFKSIILEMLVGSMQALIDFATKSLQIDLDKTDIHTQHHIEVVMAQSYMTNFEQLEPGLLSAIDALWANKIFQAAYKRLSEFHWLDNVLYYADNIRHLNNLDYRPSHEEVLMSYERTTGIRETTFQVFEDGHWRVCDVGGHRTERQKWIYCFENVGRCIFTVDITAYYRMLREDHCVYRMQEDFLLFEAVVNSRRFARTPILLLFTKLDLLEACMQVYPPNIWLPDFEGGASPEAFKAYISKRFTDLCRIKGKPIEVRFVSIKNGATSIAEEVYKASKVLEERMKVFRYPS